MVDRNDAQDIEDRSTAAPLFKHKHRNQLRVSVGKIAVPQVRVGGVGVFQISTDKASTTHTDYCSLLPIIVDPVLAMIGKLLQ
jgi:hypothetical protein